MCPVDLLKDQNQYLTIYKNLMLRIRSGEFPVDSLLPSETRLSLEYGVSRETIRKALSLLTERGLIQKRQGKGSIVLDKPSFAASFSRLSSSKEYCQEKGLPLKTQLISSQRVPLPEDIRKILNRPTPLEIWKIVRLRIIDGDPRVLDYDYVLDSSIPMASRATLQDSLYAYLENKLHYPIGFAYREIISSPADEMDQRYIGVPLGEPVFIHREMVHRDDTTLFLFSESHHPPATFHFESFARRKY